MNPKILSYICLAYRARKAVCGEFSVENAVKERKAFLVLVAEDASENTKKRFHDKCTYRDIPCRDCFSKEALGKACGKEYRSCVAICDAGFADAIQKLI